MAGITITVGVDASGVQKGVAQLGNLTAAFSGVQKQMDQMAAASTSSTAKMVSSLQSMAQQSVSAGNALGNLNRGLLQAGAAVNTSVSAFERLRQSQVAGASAMTKMVTGLQGLSQATIRLVAPQGQLSQAMLQTGRAAQTQVSSWQKLQQQYQATTGAATGLAASLKTIAAAAGIGVGLTGLVQLATRLGRSFLDSSLAMDTVRLSLAGVTGSTTVAAQELQRIQAHR